MTPLPQDDNQMDRKCCGLFAGRGARATVATVGVLRLGVGKSPPLRPRSGLALGQDCAPLVVEWLKQKTPRAELPK
jgi:hypothetical protein